MTITVQLFATFREFLPPEAANGPWVVELAAEQTVRDLLALLRLPDDLPRLVLVNGKYAESHAPLHEGDGVAIFPPLIGGR
jgi:molybdopterin converting factor small subunit